MANFPTSLVTTTELPDTRADATATATNHATDHNRIADEIIAIEAELGTDPSGSLSTVKERLNTLDNVKTATRSSDLLFVSPQIWPFISDSFVPVGTSVEIDVTISVAILQMQQTVSWDLYYGNNAVVPAGQLTPKAQGATLGTGVTHVSLPSVSSAHGNLSATLRLTGLTAGATYRFEISEGIIGGGSASAIHPGNPYKIAVSNKFPVAVQNPEWVQIVVVAMGVTDVAVVASERLFRFNDRITGTISLPNMSTPFVAVTPDGTKAVITSQGQASPQSVFIINTGAAAAASQGDAIGVPTLAATLTMAASEIVQPVAITPDGTRAWIGFQGGSGRGGTIVPINLSTNAITTPASAALVTTPASSMPTDIAIDSTGTNAYVVTTQATNNIKKVTLATGAVAATGSTGLSSGTPFCALSPDNATLYVVNSTSPASIVTVRTSDLAVLNTTAVLPTVATPTDIEVMSDGLSVFITSNHTSTQEQVIQYVPAYNAFFTTWGLGTAGPFLGNGLALSSFGDIWVTNYSAQLVHCWPGCQSRFVTSPTLTTDYGEVANVRVRGAN